MSEDQANWDQVVQMPVEELQSNPLQPRGVITPESLVDLVDSIREHGILEPLVVAKTPAGYQIIAGERRWRAARIVGSKTVPVIIKETTPRGMLEMAIVENVQRIDLNPLERAKAFQRLHEEFALSTSEVARRIGKSQSYVSNTMRLLSLPDALKDGILGGLITEGHARALMGIGDNRTMVEAYKILLRESGSVRRAEDLARRMRVGEVRPEPRVTFVVGKDIDEMRQGLEDSLTRWYHRVKVEEKRSSRETKIYLVFKGSLDETEEVWRKLHRVVDEASRSG